MKSYLVLINGEPVGRVDATGYKLALLAAKVAYGRRCDVIGPK